jgi:hypothetical protein
MQASKIKLSGEYAIRYAGELRALRIVSLNSVRNYKGTSNTVTGYVLNDDGTSMEDGDGKIIQSTLAVSDLLGEFSDYSEMVRARQAKHAENEAIKKATADTALALVHQFYHLTGQALPNKLDYMSMFNTSHNGRVEIQAEGVRLLLEAIRTMQREVA